MTDIKLSPEKGFTNTAPTIDTGDTAKQWFEKIFDPKKEGVSINLDPVIIFDQKHLKDLVDKTKALDLCFAKQKLTTNKNTIVAASTKSQGPKRVLHTDLFYVGNAFALKLDFKIPEPSSLSTKWPVNICAPGQLGIKTGTIELIWLNYRTALIDPKNRYFLTVSFSRSKIDEILNVNNPVKIAFAHGFADLTIDEHLPECNVIGPKIRVETLTAFGLDAQGKVISGPYLPTESWPVKYLPYSGAGDGLIQTFGQKVVTYIKNLFR